jgi:protein translocase SecG subunit
MVLLSYSIQFLIILALIGIIMIQKGGDGLFASSKAFGIRGRSNTIIRITYFLAAAFLLNSLLLGILYKRKHKMEMITSTSIENSQSTEVQKEVIKDAKSEVNNLEIAKNIKKTNKRKLKNIKNEL